MRATHGIYLATLTACLIGSAGIAGADVTIERSSSILVFPKIIADGTRDTIIQITNTSNSIVRAHCFYVNAAPTDPTRDPGPLNPPLWLEIDFTISLTRQQPTYWIVSEGREVNPLDGPCQLGTCYAGFDPGRVPPVVPDFVGELKCVEVDGSGAPLSGNHLLGVATLVDRDIDSPVIPDRIIADSSKYNAIGVLGEENNGDPTLVLGGGQCQANGVICRSDDDCGGEGPCVLEYNACPETWILNHQAFGADDIVLNDETLVPTDLPPATVETEITIVPCTQNFETQIPTTVTLQFLTFNEFESQFSVSTSVTCWANIPLDTLGAPALTIEGQPLDPLGSSFLQTRIRSASGTPYGIFMVAEEFHFAKPSVSGMDLFTIGASAAFSPHVEGDRPVPDLITIPADQLEP